MTRRNFLHRLSGVSLAALLGGLLVARKVEARDKPDTTTGLLVKHTFGGEWEPSSDWTMRIHGDGRSKFVTAEMMRAEAEYFRQMEPKPLVLVPRFHV